MQILPTDVIDEIKNLKKAYLQMGPIRKFFFPQALASAIEADENHLTIGKTVFSSTRFYHRWLFPFLNNFFAAEPIQSAEELFKYAPRPNISTDTKALENTIQKLINFYKNLDRIGKIFFPRALAEAIDSNKSPLEIGAAAFRSSWFFHRLFFPYLNDFFNNDIIQASRWLFDSTSLPGSLVGNFIENNADKISHELAKDRHAVEQIEILKADYQNYLPFSKYFFPRSLAKLLDPEDKTPNQNIAIIQAVHRDTYFYHEWLFSIPSTQFRSGTNTAFKTINDSIFPDGTRRIERNISTLNKLAKTVKDTKATFPDLQISDTLDTEIASLIALLNPPSKNSNLNAQNQLEKIRSINKRTEGPLFVCDALSLYFRNKEKIILETEDPKNSDVYQFNRILETFNEAHTSDIYRILRNKKIPLLQGSGETTRKNIIDITKIKQKANAAIIFELLTKTELLFTDAAQTIFNLVIAHDDLNALKEELKSLNEHRLLTCESLNKVARRDSPVPARHIVEATQAILEILRENKFDISEDHPTFKRIASYSNDIRILEDIIEHLANSDLLIPERLDRVMNHSNPDVLERALRKMIQHKVLTKDTFEQISADNIDSAVEVLKILPPQKTLPTSMDEVVEKSLQATTASELGYALVGGAVEWLGRYISPQRKSPTNTDKLPTVETNIIQNPVALIKETSHTLPHQKAEKHSGPRSIVEQVAQVLEHFTDLEEAPENQASTTIFDRLSSYVEETLPLGSAMPPDDFYEVEKHEDDVETESEISAPDLEHLMDSDLAEQVNWEDPEDKYLDVDGEKPDETSIDEEPTPQQQNPMQGAVFALYITLLCSLHEYTSKNTSSLGPELLMGIMTTLTLPLLPVISHQMGKLVQQSLFKQSANQSRESQALDEKSTPPSVP